jgi:hypothetical protein
MRLGLIGLGRIGAFHAQTLTDLPVVDSLVVTDAVPALTADLAARLGAEPADTPAALLAAGVDGVVVAAATDAHPTLILAAVEAGLPVFCEKPVARTMAEGLEVRPGPPWPAASSAGCTRCGRPPWTRPRRRRPMWPSPAASSATAACTTSTASAG